MEKKIDLPTVGAEAVNGQAAAKKQRAFGIRDLFGYFMGDFGCNMSFTLINSYMFIFFTQYIGISLGHYAIVILISKILDGINDPIVGAIVDKMGADKNGNKFKQWILIGGPILSIAASLMFFDVSSWPYIWRLVWCILSYVAWDITFTIVNVPYGALNSVMTIKPTQRAGLSSARAWGGAIAGVPLGIIIPMLAYKTVTAADGSSKSVFQGNAMFPIALALGAVAVVSFALLYFNVEERIVHKEKKAEKFSYIQMMKGFLTNKAAIAISLASIAQILFVNSASQLHQLTYQMYFHDGQLSAYQVLAQIIPLIVGTVMGSFFVGKFGKKEMTIWPSLGAIVVYTFMYFTPVSNPILWIGLQIVGNSFAFGIVLYTWALVSDAIDYQEWRTGDRNEASIYATYSMFRKVASGLGQSIVPAVIAFLLPTLNVSDPTTWTAEAGETIRGLSALFPLCGYVLIFIILLVLYPLNHRKMGEMEQALHPDVNEGIDPEV